MSEKILDFSEKKEVGEFFKDEDEITKLLTKLVEHRLGDKISLDRIEESLTDILKFHRKNVTEKIMESKDPEEMICPHCGRKMEIIDRRKRKIKGLADYEFRRRNFYCGNCNMYEKPLYRILDCAENFTLEVREAMILLGQRVTFEEANFFMKKLLKVEASHESIQEYTENIGRLIAEDEKKRVMEITNSDGYVKPEFILESTDFGGKEGAKKSGTVYMELDGSMVQTREEGWKEVRNGIIFSEENRAEVDKHHNKILEKKYFSVFNNGENFLENFNNRATQAANDFGFHQYQRQVILGDGAIMIWDYATTYHPDAIQILDYYHACEYLGDALKSIEFKDERQSETVSKKTFKLLEKGKITQIIDWLQEQKQTDKVIVCIRYFNKNISRMDYGRYKKMKLDIGSGAIESAHRILVQIRMKQSGMHWGKKNIQSIVSLRAKYLSGEWKNVVEYLKAA